MSSIRVGSFTRQAGTGAQAVTGIGFLPVALILWSSNQTAAGYTDGYHWHQGLTDGTFSVALSCISDDNAGTSEVHRTYEEGAIYRSINSAGTLLARATFTSFNADGFTLNWATNDGVQSIINYIAIGGDVEAKCGVFDCPTAAGSQAVTGVGFQPSAALFMAAWHTDTSHSADFLSSPSIGWTSGAGEEGATGQSMEDGAAASNTFRYQAAKAITQLRSGISGSVGNIFFEADLTSFDADGFTLDWTSGPADSTAVGVYYLALSGIRAQAGVLTQPTSTGEDTVSGLGFQPSAVLFQTAGLTAAQTTPQSNSSFWFGAGDGTRQRGTFLGETDAADPTVNARGQIEDKVIALATPNATGSSTAAVCAAELSSLDNDGFTVEWTTADATQRQVLYLALGDFVIQGSAVFGVNGTVKSTRSVLFSLDGETNELNSAGTFKVVADAIELDGPLTLPADSVENADLANMAQATIKGRASGAGTGDPTDLSANQVSTILDSATDPFVRTSAGGAAINQLTGDVTAGPGSGSQAATIANDAVTNAKAANMAQATVKGRAAAAGTGDPTDLTPDQVSTILDSATDPFLRTSAAAGGGDVDGPASSTDNAIARFDGTTGKLLQNTSALTVADDGTITFPDGIRQTFNPNGTNAGLNVGSQAGDPSAPSNGDIWYDSTANELTARINGANVALGAGGGTAAWSQVGSWTFSVNVTHVDFNISAGYQEILIMVFAVTTSVNTQRGVRVSTDGGSTFYAGAGDYVNMNATGSPTNAVIFNVHDTNATAARDGMMWISCPSLNGVKKPMACWNRGVAGYFNGSTSPLTHVRVIPQGGGNMTGGSIVVLGR